MSMANSPKHSTIELELNEEERAELLKSLAVGLSDSSTIHETSTKFSSFKKEKKTFIGPPRPVHRDAMGRYIPKPGGKPLSVYDVPSPGPDHYKPDPTAVLKKFPEYSMGERGMIRRVRKRWPAPNKYDLSTNLLWDRCKTITFKEKKFSKIDGSYGPGPAAHADRTRSMGGPTYTMRGRPKTEAMHGFVSSLVRNPDPTVPGPQYTPYRDEWLDKPVSFGHKQAPQNSKKNSKAPGPSAYFIRSEPAGPKWKIAERYKDDTNQNSPGPAKYKIRRLVPEKKPVSMGIKHAIIKDKNPIPGPNEYKNEMKILTDPGFTMQYRWYETKVEKSPGPGNYRPKKESTQAKSPAYTMQRTWPKGKVATDPGPADYNVFAQPLDKGRTIGLRHKEDFNANPSPADYLAEESDTKRRASAPAFSFTRARWKSRDDLGDIGPYSYCIQDIGVIKPAKTFGIRHHRREITDGPGPAPRIVMEGIHHDPRHHCECDRFATVKSRHTPIKYSGFRNIGAVEKPRAGVPQAPLLG